MRKFLLCWLALTGAVVAALSLAARANMVQMPLTTSGGASTFTQWNSNDKDPTITLATTSQANDTAIAGSAGTWVKVRGTNTTPHTSGKYHIEFLAPVVANNGWMAGFDDGGGVLGEYCGANAAGHGIGAQMDITSIDMHVYYQGTIGGNWSVTGIAAGDRIAIEVDLTAKLLWFMDVNKTGPTGWSDLAGAFTGSPSTGTSGFALGSIVTTGGVMPCWSGNTSSKVQMITKLTGFTATVSGGATPFTAWDPP